MHHVFREEGVSERCREKIFTTPSTMAALWTLYVSNKHVFVNYFFLYHKSQIINFSWSLLQTKKWYKEKESTDHSNNLNSNCCPSSSEACNRFSMNILMVYAWMILGYYWKMILKNIVKSDTFAFMWDLDW